MNLIEANRKINILFVVIGLGLGGSERVVLDLVQNIDKARFNVYTAYFQKGELYRSFSRACNKLFHLKKKDGFDFRTMCEIGRIIGKNDIDIINCHHHFPFVYSYMGSKLIHNRILIFTQHSVAEVDEMPAKHKLFCNLAFFGTNSVVGVSKEITLSLQKAYPFHSNRMICIPNGVDANRFAVRVDPNKMRSDLGILPSHFVIGTVANFRKVKNHACLIRAFRRLADTYPEIRLLFVGRGFANAPEDSEDDIKRLIRSYNLTNRIVFAGYRNDIPYLLKIMDIFCLPSFAEGLPVSILEAMAAGVPIVASNVSGIKELISTGKTGVLFPSNDDGMLAKALEKLIKNLHLRFTLSKKAFEFVRQEHGIDHWINRYEQLFGSIRT